MLNYKAVFLIFALLPLLVRGDEKAVRQVILRNLGLGASQSGISVGQEGKPFDFTLTVQNLAQGRPYNYSGPDEVAFAVDNAAVTAPAATEANPDIAPVAAEVSPAKGGEKNKTRLIGKVKLPKTGSNFLVVWAKAGQGKYTITALPDDTTALPANSLRFVNLTSAVMNLKIKDGEQGVLKAKETAVIATGARQQLYFTVEIQKDGEESSFISNVVETRPGLRQTVFLFKSASAEFGANPEDPPVLTFYKFTHPIEPPPVKAGAN